MKSKRTTEGKTHGRDDNWVCRSQRKEQKIELWILVIFGKEGHHFLGMRGGWAKVWDTF